MAGIFDFFPKQGGGGVLPASDPGEAQSLALLNAMGPIGQAGTTRTAGPVGSIAQNLIPVLGAMIQAKALQAQSQQQAQMQDLQKQYLLAKIAGAGGNPDMQAARLEQTKAETELTQARTKAVGQPQTGSLTDNQLYAQEVAGDPTAAAILNAKQADALARANALSEVTAARTTQLQEAADARKQQRLLEGPPQAAPEYRGKVILHRDTLTQPKQVTLQDMQDPASPYVALDPNQAKIVQGAKVVSQQLDRLEKLIPEVLPESNWGLLGKANSLKAQSLDEKVVPKAAELKRLGQFEQMSGIKDFIAGRGPNQAEIHGIGAIDPTWDSQQTAAGKLAAMRGLLADNLQALGLNPDAVTGGVKTPVTLTPSPPPSSPANELSTFADSLIKQGASREEFRRKMMAYKESHPGVEIDLK